MNGHVQQHGFPSQDRVERSPAGWGGHRGPGAGEHAGVGALAGRYPPLPPPRTPSPRLQAVMVNYNGGPGQSELCSALEAGQRTNTRRDIDTVAGFAGRSTLCWEGRLVCGPPEAIKTTSLSVILITVPGALFLAFPGIALLNLSPAFEAVCALLIFMTLVFLWLAATTDPGILPRATKDSYLQSAYFPMLHDFVVDGVTHRLKYCSTCHIYRSLRASHCSDCDNCVMDFDHHCPWVGTCIARRNYKYFVMFVFHCTLLCVYVFVCCFIQIAYANTRAKPATENYFNFSEDFKSQPVSFLLIAYTFIIVWSVGSLTAFHCVLLCKGKTTREFMKRQADGPRISASKRWHEVFCATTPSYIQVCRDEDENWVGLDLFDMFKPFVVLSCGSASVRDQLNLTYPQARLDELNARFPGHVTPADQATLGFEPHGGVAEEAETPSSQSSRCSLEQVQVDGAHGPVLSVAAPLYESNGVGGPYVPETPSPQGATSLMNMSLPSPEGAVHVFRNVMTTGEGHLDLQGSRLDMSLQSVTQSPESSVIRENPEPFQCPKSGPKSVQSNDRYSHAEIIEVDKGLESIVAQPRDSMANPYQKTSKAYESFQSEPKSLEKSNKMSFDNLSTRDGAKDANGGPARSNSHPNLPPRADGYMGFEPSVQVRNHELKNPATVGKPPELVSTSVALKETNNNNSNSPSKVQKIKSDLKRPNRYVTNAVTSPPPAPLSQGETSSVMTSPQTSPVLGAEDVGAGGREAAGRLDDAQERIMQTAAPMVQLDPRTHYGGANSFSVLKGSESVRKV